jgi:hypothetical protein
LTKGGISDSQKSPNIRMPGSSASNLRMWQHVLRCPRFHSPVSEDPCRRGSKNVEELQGADVGLVPWRNG